MESICNSFLNIGYRVWNVIVGELAWGLFKNNPREALPDAGGVPFYTGVIEKVLDTMMSIMVPLLLLFFFLKILKELITTPWEQFYKKILYSFLHFLLISWLCLNIKTVNNTFIDCTQLVADQLLSSFSNRTVSENVNPNPRHGELDVADEEYTIPGIDIQMKFESSGDPQLKKACEELDKENFLVRAIGYVMIMLACMGAALAWGSSAIIILKAAYTRLLKPLIMLPLSGIAIAMSAGSENMGRTTYAFYKQIAIFILAGPFMGLCIAAAKYLNFTIPADSGASALTCVLLMVATIIIRPMIIAGLVKEASNTIQQFS